MKKHLSIMTLLIVTGSCAHSMVNTKGRLTSASQTAPLTAMANNQGVIRQRTAMAKPPKLEKRSRESVNGDIADEQQHQQQLQSNIRQQETSLKDLKEFNPQDSRVSLCEQTLNNLKAEYQRSLGIMEDYYKHKKANDQLKLIDSE